MMLEKNRFNDDKNQPQQENKDSGPVDPMHIPHPLRIRLIGIPLPDIEILPDLSPDTHILN
jgi:hypothetical protein